MKMIIIALAFFCVYAMASDRTVNCDQGAFKLQGPEVTIGAEVLVSLDSSFTQDLKLNAQGDLVTIPELNEFRSGIYGTLTQNLAFNFSPNQLILVSGAKTLGIFKFDNCIIK